MKRRDKNGDTWYSHRLPDGSWCKGGCGDQPGERVDVTQFGWSPRGTSPSCQAARFRPRTGLPNEAQA